MNNSNTSCVSRTGENDPVAGVRDFQRKLYRKAKQEPEFRFYSLYDKVYRIDFLSEAYKRVKSSGGASGIDGISFKDIEADGGLMEYLLDIQRDLQNGIYRPLPVKRVYIPKAEGSMRPLGVPTIRDRIVQMSCKLVIEPIFESDFMETSFGFRPKKSASEALKAIKSNLKAGYTEVYDADLSKYFDTIPHAKLMKLVALRISDRRVLHLIKLWLKSPVSTDGKLSGGKKNKLGTPQGGVISPLLANIYLNLLDKLVNSRKVFHGIKIVRYADDFVLMGKRIGALALRHLKQLLDRMELKINETKSHLLQAGQTPFEFLGFVIRNSRCHYEKGHYYCDIRPSDKSMKKLRSGIKQNLLKNRYRSTAQAVRELNPLLRGWLNYFTIDGVCYMKTPRRKLGVYLRGRLYRHQKRKSQRYRYDYCRSTFTRWVKEHGLIDPEAYGT